MRSLYYSLVLLLPVFCLGGAPWLSKDLPKYSQSDFSEKNRQKSFYEIVASRAPYATLLLNKVAVFPLSEIQAKGFVGKHYECPAGCRPYLVRGIYASSTNGGFSVHRIPGDILWVEYTSLGGQVSEDLKTALVVNLDFAPQEIVVISAAYE